MGRRIARLARDERGIAAVEYCLIASLIVVTMMAAWIELGGASSAIWNRIVQSFPEWSRFLLA